MQFEFDNHYQQTNKNIMCNINTVNKVSCAHICACPRFKKIVYTCFIFEWCSFGAILAMRYAQLRFENFVLNFKHIDLKCNWKLSIKDFFLPVNISRAFAFKYSTTECMKTFLLKHEFITFPRIYISIFLFQHYIYLKENTINQHFCFISSITLR